MSALEELRALAERVEANIDRQRARLQRDIDEQVKRGWTPAGQLVPEDMLDQHSRPILLDAQIALLNARLVLAEHEPEIRVVNNFTMQTPE